MLADPTYTSFCDVSETWSCLEAFRSRYGAFQGVPVAVFGAIWFAFATLLAVAGMTARQEIRESVSGYLFAGSTFALAVVLYLGYASFMVLGVRCPLCLVTYAAVIGLFLVSGAATSLPMLSLPRRALQDVKVLAASPLALVLAVLWIGGGAATLAFFPREAVVAADATPEEAAAEAAAVPVSQDQRSELERHMATSERVPLAVPADGAKVVVVKFNDYQCPACAQSYLAYKPVLAKYEASHPGQVKVVVKDYPLNADCNSAVRTQFHAAACEAAVAVRLARAKGRAEALEDWLFTHQKEMTPASVREAAREIGQVTDFDARREATLTLVKGDIALGQQLKVTSTPTFFINGVRVDGAWAAQFFDQAIAYELKHAK
jgi:protein-disulfide isomerase